MIVKIERESIHEWWFRFIFWHPPGCLRIKIINWSRIYKKRGAGRVFVNISVNWFSVGIWHMWIRPFSTCSRIHHIRIANWRLRTDTTGLFHGGLFTIWMHTLLSSYMVIDCGGTRRHTTQLRAHTSQPWDCFCDLNYRHIFGLSSQQSAVDSHTIVVNLVSHIIGHPWTQTP